MMESRYTLKNTALENRVFYARIVTILIFVVLLLLGLVSRLVYLQIVGHQHYASLATRNRIKTSSIPPTRGIIYDRHGRVLADNFPSYSLEIIPEQVKDLDDTLQRLQVLLDIPDEKIADFHKQRKRRKRFVATPLLLRLSEEKVAKFAIMRPFFTGVDIQARLIRQYPYSFLTAHVVGYVGRINVKELKKLPVSEYSGTYHIGKNGIEKSYESLLHGKAGYKEVETNAQGRDVNVLTEVEPESGVSLYLTLDIDLQKTAYEALEGYNGSIVAIEIKTGDVLAFASRPAYDPNPFVYGISRKAYAALRDSEDRPLFNRALRGQYPPGSTVKPFIGLAGLEYNLVSFRDSIYCPGYYQIPNNKHKFRDWKRWGHGTTDLDKAITQSCDVYFYDLAVTMGIDKMHKFMTKFGFGQKTGIDLSGEKSGLFPSREWKRSRKKKPWYPGNSIITGIGQGFTLTTPLQLARATATLGNRGKIVTPYLVDRIIHTNYTVSGPEQSGEVIDLKAQNLDNVLSAMINVVHSPRGTAKRIAKGIDYQIAGKTGTAQVFTVKQDARYNENTIDFKLRDHALFMSFAPAADPQIAIAVIVENGGHGGSVAAPMAGKVIRQFLEPKQEVVDEDGNAQ